MRGGVGGRESTERKGARRDEEVVRGLGLEGGHGADLLLGQGEVALVLDGHGKDPPDALEPARAGGALATQRGAVLFRDSGRRRRGQGWDAGLRDVFGGAGVRRGGAPELLHDEGDPVLLVLVADDHDVVDGALLGRLVDDVDLALGVRFVYCVRRAQLGERQWKKRSAAADDASRGPRGRPRQEREV